MTTDAVGGVWTYAMELARALRPAGVEFILATMGPELTAQQARQAASMPNLTLCPSQWKLEWMNDPWSDVDAAGCWLLDLEERFAPDLIHLNGYAHGALPWRAPVIVIGHSCVLSWWRAVKGGDAPAEEWRTYRTRIRAGLAAADCVIAPSDAMLQALREWYGPLPAGRVIYNARQVPASAASDKQPLILSAGRVWDEAKNIAALQTVAAELDWPVYLAGETLAPDGSAAKADGVRRLGRLDEAALLRWMRAASIYCLPAKYEPFGLSALEAALCGCALVLGDIPSLREVWGDAARFVPPADTAGLRQALNELIRDDAHRQNLARRARERARRYCIQRMADEYLLAYRQWTAAAQPRPAATTPPSAAASPASLALSSRKF